MIGQPASALDTPTLLVDLDILEANIARIAGSCAAHGVAWRPHIKVHKTPEIAALKAAVSALQGQMATLQGKVTTLQGLVAALKAEGAVYAPDQRAALLRDLKLPALQKVVGHLTATGAAFQMGTPDDGMYWQVTATTPAGATATLGFEPYNGRLVRVGGWAQ